MTNLDIPYKPSTGGRPGFQLTEEVKAVIEARARESCSKQAIAMSLGISDDVLADNKDFAECYKKARAEYLIELHRCQKRKAIDKDDTIMQIWLGKQDLGQSDKREDTVHSEQRKTFVFVLSGNQPAELATESPDKVIDVTPTALVEDTSIDDSQPSEIIQPDNKIA